MCMAQTRLSTSSQIWSALKRSLCIFPTSTWQAELIDAEFWGLDSVGLDFGDWISESGSQVKPILLKFWALFSLHISTYLYFYFLSSLDVTFLFQGLGFRYWIFSLHIWTSTFCLHLTLYLPFSGTRFQELHFEDWISGTEFWGLDFGDWILGIGFWGLDFRRKPSQTNFLNVELCAVYISLLLFSVFIWHYLPVSGTGFQVLDFGDWISEGSQVKPILLNLEVCSLYISLLISTSIFCLHLTLPFFFRDQWGLDLESWNRDLFSLHIWTSTFCLHFTLPSFFRDQVSGTEFRGPNFGDRISGTGFRRLDFRRKPSQTNSS